MHACINEEWTAILDQHKARQDMWPEFQEKYDKFFPNSPCDPTMAFPSGGDLWKAIHDTKAGSAAGSDGWKPEELRWLPKESWK